MGFELKEGTTFAGRYQIVRALGEGAMGAVYEVVHLETERRRALKVMHGSLFHEEDLWERFRREAKVAARVDSEFIVDVFDAGVDEATRLPYILMELLRGEDLERRVERLGRLPPAEVLTYLHQVALALDKTHAASIVHRDLKPENLFLTQREDGQPRIKVLDFGIAKLVAGGPGAARATQNIGTPLYMAPEQLSGDAALSGAADLYALAMVAYTLLVGTPYWTSEARSNNLMAMLSVVGRGPVQPACSRAAAHGVALPPSFNAWFATAAALEPEERFRKATEMVHALAIALGLPPPAAGVMPPSGPHDSGALGAHAARAHALGPGGSTSAFTTAAPASTSPPALRQRRSGLTAILIALGVGCLLGASAYAVHLGRAPATEEVPGAAPIAVGAPPAPPLAPAPVPAGIDAAPSPASAAEPATPAPTASAATAPSASTSAGPPAGKKGTPLRQRYTRD